MSSILRIPIAASRQHRANRLKQKTDIQGKRKITRVIRIEKRLVLIGYRIPTRKLGVARDPGARAIYTKRLTKLVTDRILLRQPLVSGRG